MTAQAGSMVPRTVLVLLLMTAAGCGGSGPANSPSAARATAPPTSMPTPTPLPALPAACQVVTIDEAQQLAHTPLDPGVESSAGASSTCTYGAPVTGPTAQVVVELGNKAKQILDVDQQLGNKLTPLPGIGDEAYEEEGNVFVRKGTLWCTIHLVRLSSPGEDRVPLEDLLNKVVTRL